MSVNIKQNGSLVKISGSSSWTGTRAEYEVVKDDIPVGSVVNIIDDEDFKLILPSEQQQVYSTDEIQVGTWIDDKPIYRKVITVTFSSTSKISNTEFYISNEIPLKITNIEKAWFIGDKSYFTLDKARSFVYGSIEITNGNAGLYLMTLYSRTNATGTIVVEYTKTTD